MFEQLKKQLNEIVEVANQCPEAYRERCFSILLEHFLTSQEKPKAPSGAFPKITSEAFLREWPIEFSRFIEEHKLTETVSRVFHLEEGKCEIIVKDLNTKKKATGQVRLALLLGVKHMAEEGLPNVPNEDLRQLCSSHALFDTANFASIMKKNKNLFLSIKGKGWKLTKPGENEAGAIIKELAGVSE